MKTAPDTEDAHPGRRMPGRRARSIRWFLALFLLTLSGPILAEDSSEAEKQPQAQKDANEFRFLLRKPPSLRFGKLFRIDFRAKFQGVFRGFSPPVTTDEGLFEFRRKRVSIEGTFLKHFEYEVESELRREDHWKDVNLNFRYFRNFQIKAGKFKLPFGMEQTTGTMSLDFAYRSLLSDNLTPSRDRGIIAHGRFWERGLNYEGGIFVRDGDNSLSKRSTGAERTFAGRVSGTPLRLVAAPDYLRAMEFGLAMTSGTVPEGLKGLRGQTIVTSEAFFPEFYVHGQRRRLGLQWDWSPGPFSLKSEWVQYNDQRRGQSIRGTDLCDLISRGWYAAGTWVITGESKAGGVEPKKPFLEKGGLGAVELAARFEVLRFGSSEHIGLASRSPRAANILENSNRAWTVGINWYLNRWVKIQTNGIREKLEDPQRSPIPGKTLFYTWLCHLQFVM